MICHRPRVSKTAQDLAREIAADPAERKLLAAIPRAEPSEAPGFKPQLKDFTKKAEDVENTLKGLRARVELLEHKLGVVEAQNKELATELRNIASAIRAGEVE